jgi:hypothetical protein
VKKVFGVLGLAMVVAAIMAIGLAGTVFASDGNSGQGNQTQNQGEVCPCGDGDCGDCVPNEYLEPGPHGLGGSASAAGGSVDQGAQTQNRGEVCPAGDCVSGDCEPNDYSYSYKYSEPGPHGAQKGSSD